MGMVHRSLTPKLSCKTMGICNDRTLWELFQHWKLMLHLIWSSTNLNHGTLKNHSWLQKFLDKSSRRLCTFESAVRFDVLILNHKLAGSWRRKLWWERPSYTKPAENVQPLACYSTGRNQLEGSQAGCPANIETLLWFCMIQNTFVISSEYFISQDSEPSNCSHTTW